MKKILSIVLVLALAFCLCACGNNGAETSSATSTTTSQTESVNSTVSQVSSETSSQVSSETPSQVSSTATSSTTTTTTSSTAPTTLNPETEFKFGKYVAKFFSNDKKTYIICKLTFDKEYMSLQYEKATYYTKEECERLYGGDFGFDADNLSEDFSKITLDGVPYYTFYYGYENIPDLFKLTNTAIKLSTDAENWTSLSLKSDGTLVVATTDDNRYGSVGTIYNLEKE